MARQKYELNDQDRWNRNYYQREEGLNVTRIFIFIFIGVGLLAGILAIATPNGGSAAQPVVRMNFRCLFVPGLFVGFMILRALWIAITGSWAERREVKQMEKARRQREAAEHAPVVQHGPIRKFNEPVMHRSTSREPKVDPLVEEIRERQKLLRQINFEKRWQRSLRHGTQLQRPFDMSDREWYSRPVWTSDDIYQWLKERQE